MAEGLVDREQVMREAVQESQQSGKPFDQEAYEVAYRAKLHPYIDAGRLTAGAVIVATGRDPCHAIAAATNALENNFEQSIPLPAIGTLLRIGINITGLLRQAYTAAQLAALYEKQGVGGTFLKFVEDGVIQVKQLPSGQTCFVIGDEIFETPQEAWKVVVNELPFCQDFEKAELAKGRSLYDTFTNPAFVEKIDGLKVTGGDRSEKKAHDAKKSSSAAQGKASSSGGGATGAPNPDQEPEYKRSGFQKGDKIDKRRFNQKCSKGNWKDPKTGEILSPERSGKPHGGSAWKLFKDEKALGKNDRSATFAADGTFLRK